MVVKNKRSAAVLIAVFAAFVVVVFLAHGSITTLFSHSHKDEESFNAWQLQHQEKLQELLRLETAGALQMKSVQQEMQVLQQHNLQLRASLKAASARASTGLESGAGSRETPALELTSTPKQRKWLGPPKVHAPYTERVLAGKQIRSILASVTVHFSAFSYSNVALKCTENVHSSYVSKQYTELY